MMSVQSWYIMYFLYFFLLFLVINAQPDNLGTPDFEKQASSQWVGSLFELLDKFKIVARYEQAGIGIGIGIKGLGLESESEWNQGISCWNRNRNRNQSFEFSWNRNRNRNQAVPGIVHHCSRSTPGSPMPMP